MIGSCIGGWLIDKFGRKGSILMSAVPFELGWLLISFAKNHAMLYAGRIITGLACGVVSLAVPVSRSWTLSSAEAPAGHFNKNNNSWKIVSAWWTWEEEKNGSISFCLTHSHHPPPKIIGLWKGSPERTTDISRGHHSLPRKMTPEKLAQKFQTDDAWLPRSTILGSDSDCRAAWEICLSQLEALPRSGKSHVISMEFLGSFLRRHLAGKPVERRQMWAVLPGVPFQRPII